MDKITIVDSDALFTQLLYPIFHNNQLFAYTVYDIKSVKILFLF